MDRGGDLRARRPGRSGTSAPPRSSRSTPQITLSHAYLPRHIGTASGVTLGLSLSLGGFLTPALGSLADHTAIRDVFVLVGALLTAGFLCTLWLRERPREESPEGLLLVER